MQLTKQPAITTQATTEGIQCTHCGSTHYIKNGRYEGCQRYKCKDCGRAFSDKVRKFTYTDKERVLELYLNNTGIRKCAAFIGCSPSLIIQWIREFANNLRRRQYANDGDISEEDIAASFRETTPHVIEMDEIYTRIGKGKVSIPVWIAYSRNMGKVVAFSIGYNIDCAFQLYYQTQDAVGEIARIYTDGNGAYTECFSRIGIWHKHHVAKGKSQTYRVESVNSSIRDNLARFNRRSKRYSKKLDMLENTLLLFFHYKQYERVEPQPYEIAV